MISVPRLYPIVDARFFQKTEDLMAFAAELIAAGCTLLQYRNKNGNGRVMLEQARELKKLLTSGTHFSQNVGEVGHPKVRLIMNDRADLALGAGFDGVHVGQDDLLPESVRRYHRVGAHGLGVSTHNPNQLEEAERTTADYLAIGPVFSTSSKERPDPVVGLEGVRRARQLTSKPSGCDWRDHASECGFGD